MVARLSPGPHYDRAAILARGAEVIRTEADALVLLADRLDGPFVDACELILAATGRVVVTGMGKSGHIGRKVAATHTLASWFDAASRCSVAEAEAAAVRVTSRGRVALAGVLNIECFRWKPKWLTDQG